MTRVGDPQFADCLFEVGEDKVLIHGHRAILRANEYFAAMFTSRMAESNTRDPVTNELVPIPISNISPEVFSRLLRCIYNNKFDGDGIDTAEEFVEFATVCDSHLLKGSEEGLIRLLRNQMFSDNFWKWAIPYRNISEDKKLPRTLLHLIAIYAVSLCNELDSKKHPEKNEYFVANCDIHELDALACGLLQQDGHLEGYSIAQFGREILIPAARRITGKQAISDLYKELRWNGDWFRYHGWHWTCGAMNVRFLLEDEKLPNRSVYLDPDVCAEKDAVMYKANCSKENVFFANVRDPKCLLDPKEQLSVQLASTEELKQLIADKNEIIERELLTFRVAKLHYACLTVLHRTIKAEASSQAFSFVGLPVRFFKDFLSDGNMAELDSRLSANLLAAKVFEHLTQPGQYTEEKGATATTIYRTLLRRIPWPYVEPQLLFKCMALDEKVTGMGDCEWGAVMRALHSPKLETVRLHQLNYTGDDVYVLLAKPARIAAALINELQRKNEGSNNSHSGSKRKNENEDDEGHRGKRARTQ